MNITVKNLQKHFRDLTKKDAEKIAAYVDGKTTRLLRRPMPFDGVLDFANDAIGGHGVETMRGTKAPGANWEDYTVMEFVNMGDSYTMTIVYDLIARKYEMTDLGTWLEKHGHRKEYGIEAYENGER